MTTDPSNLIAILEWRKFRRPRAWIAREMGLRYEDVQAVLRVAKDTERDNIALAQYDAIEKMVNQACSLSEIRRTLGSDARTVKRWFPNAGWSVGGEGAAMMKKGREILEEASIK
jgi:hypothetical protein